MILEFLISNNMNKILQATSRGQITLPKNWRDKFETNYYIIEIKDDSLSFKPLMQKKSFKDEVENSWKEYKEGKFIDHDSLKKKYGL